jgi:hypothetical protein
MSIAESVPVASPYIDTVRRSYSTLVHIAHVVGGVGPQEMFEAHLRGMAQIVGGLVYRLVWADRRVAPGEETAIRALIAEDPMLEPYLRAGDDAGQLPEFLLACTVYDRHHGTRLTGSAINALESLGLALLACDREISSEEISALQGVIGPWRQAGIQVVRG